MKKTTLLKTMLLLCALIVGSLNSWADTPVVSSLYFGTPQVSENFNGLSTYSATAVVSNSSYTANGSFNKMYNNSTDNTYAVASNNTFSSNVLSLRAGGGSPLIASITGKTFGTKGAFKIKVLKTSICYVGFYADDNNTAYAKASSSVYIQNNNGTLTINDGSSNKPWISVGAYSSDIIDIVVIYNNTNTASTYGESISLAAKTAHIYVNGNCVMNGQNPKDFSIPGTSLTAFRVMPTPTNGNTAIVDDVEIYNSLPAPSYTITPTVNDADMGSVALTDATTITATPNSGYRVKSGTEGYTVTSGTATVTHTGHSNTLSVSAASDCTVQVNFEETPSYTATFSVNGITSTEDFLEDASVTFPSAPTNLGGKVFRGWKKDSGIVGTTDVAPSFVNTTEEKMGNADVTYYAVFATSAETTNWQKYAASAIPGEGVYALLTTDGHAFNGSISSGHGQVTTNAFSFTDNIATSAPSGTCEITLVAVTGGYKMYNSTNKYLYASKAASGGLAWHDSEDSYWKYANNNWEYQKDYSGSKARLRSYSNGSIRTYSSDNGDVLVFAKKITVATYSAYCTSITASVTTNKGKWTSFTPSWNATLEDGATAYIITDVEDDVITATAVDVLKASEGYFIKGAEATTPYTVYASAEDADDVTDNLIVGCISAETIDADTPDSNHKYVLGTTGEGVSGLFLVNSSVTVAAGKAYLNTQSTTGAHTLSLDFEDGGATGIQTIEAKKELLNGDFYNLKGQRVAQPSKGLYIINGRKVVIK